MAFSLIVEKSGEKKMEEFVTPLEESNTEYENKKIGRVGIKIRRA